jgi:hypothetical protein
MKSTRFLVLLEEVHIRLLNYKVPLNITPHRIFFHVMLLLLFEWRLL